MSELRLIACSSNVDIIAITETLFNLENRDMLAECHIQGFKFFNVDRSNRIGGGVTLYIHEDLNCCLTTGTKVEGSNTESVWVEFLEGNEKLILGVLYRPPDLENELERLLWDEKRKMS